MFDNIIEMIFGGAGIYIIYQSIIMQKTGKVVEAVFTGKHFKMERANDIPGFIKIMTPTGIFLGVMLFLSGMIGMVSLNTGELNILDYVFKALSAVSFVIFMVIDSKAQKKYLFGQKSKPTKK